jgi:predicted metal-dependent hydrolase
VAHLKHPNHSPAFWQTVQALCPGYEEGKHWLKIKGKDLYRYI